MQGKFFYIYFRLFALGDVQNKCGNLFIRTRQHRVGQEDENPCPVTPDILFLVRCAFTPLVQFFDGVIISRKPFGRCYGPPVNPAVFELFARVTNQTQIIIVSFDNAP